MLQPCLSYYGEYKGDIIYYIYNYIILYIYIIYIYYIYILYYIYNCGTSIEFNCDLLELFWDLNGILMEFSMDF